MMEPTDDAPNEPRDRATEIADALSERPELLSRVFYRLRETEGVIRVASQWLQVDGECYERCDILALDNNMTGRISPERNGRWRWTARYLDGDDYVEGTAPDRERALALVDHVLTTEGWTLGLEGDELEPLDIDEDGDEELSKMTDDVRENGRRPREDDDDNDIPF